MKTFYTATEAARRLGVSRATLYAYVSRGLIQSDPGDGPHARRYRVVDVDQWAKRQAARKDPTRAAADALQWGAPVLDSALTLIQDGRLYYNGQDAVALAATASLEQIAGLLWAGALGAAPEAVGRVARVRVPPRLAPLTRFQAALPLAGQRDPAAYDLRPAGVQRTGLRILRLLTGLAIGAAPSAEPTAARLARAWKVPARARPLIEMALGLCADHELNISAFTVRCVASSGATPYAAVTAGLSALQGRRHGGLIEQVDRLLADAAHSGAARAVARWLQEQERLPGFGHPLYPQGDPRATALLRALASLASRGAEARLAAAVARQAAEHLGEKPTIDFALAALTRALALPVGSGLTLFALGRTVGWIGHALEAYATDALIRPRARYTGPLPSG